jgi:hypothetical protein
MAFLDLAFTLLGQIAEYLAQMLAMLSPLQYHLQLSVSFCHRSWLNHLTRTTMSFANEVPRPVR